MGLLQAVLDLPALGDVLDGQEDDPLLARGPLDLPGVQEHDAPADGGEIVLDLVVVEGGLLGRMVSSSSRSLGMSHCLLPRS
jgi:hypothetical protein